MCVFNPPDGICSGCVSMMLWLIAPRNCIGCIRRIVGALLQARVVLPLLFLPRTTDWANVTTLRSPFGMSRPSVVYLSSVTFACPAYRVTLFNILLHLIAQRRGQFVLKFFEKNSKGFYVTAQVQWKRGMKNWRFSTNRLLYFENGKRFGHKLCTEMLKL